MTRTIAWIALASALALGACNKKSENPPSTGMGGGSGGPMATGTGSGSGAGSATAAGSGSGAAGVTAAGSGSGSASAVTAQVDVPTEMDFERDATAKITDKNIEAQVQSIEKELEQK